jgi:hypothetical protein
MRRACARSATANGPQRAAPSQLGASWRRARGMRAPCRRDAPRGGAVRSRLRQRGAHGAARVSFVLLPLVTPQRDRCGARQRRRAPRAGLPDSALRRGCCARRAAQRGRMRVGSVVDAAQALWAPRPSRAACAAARCDRLRCSAAHPLYARCPGTTAAPRRTSGRGTPVSALGRKPAHPRNFFPSVSHACARAQRTGLSCSGKRITRASDAIAQRTRRRCEDRRS